MGVELKRVGASLKMRLKIKISLRSNFYKLARDELSRGALRINSYCFRVTSIQILILKISIDFGLNDLSLMNLASLTCLRIAKLG